MSRASEYNYALEQAMRRQIYNARVSKTTEKFYQKYMSQYEQMRRDGDFAERENKRPVVSFGT